MALQHQCLDFGGVPGSKPASDVRTRVSHGRIRGVDMSGLGTGLKRHCRGASWHPINLRNIQEHDSYSSYSVPGCRTKLKSSQKLSSDSMRGHASLRLSRQARSYPSRPSGCLLRRLSDASADHTHVIGLNQNVQIWLCCQYIRTIRLR